MEKGDQRSTGGNTGIISAQRHCPQQPSLPLPHPPRRKLPTPQGRKRPESSRQRNADTGKRRSGNKAGAGIFRRQPRLQGMFLFDMLPGSDEARGRREAEAAAMYGRRSPRTGTLGAYGPDRRSRPGRGNAEPEHRGGPADRFRGVARCREQGIARCKRGNRGPKTGVRRGNAPAQDCRRRPGKTKPMTDEVTYETAR